MNLDIRIDSKALSGMGNVKALLRIDQVTRMAQGWGKDEVFRAVLTLC
ncbi:MAG: hypothetical protein OEZ04_07070 [Nitrospinota bacterium]|nr:hypothetical protein [Nitrospinota bacterium]